MEKLRTLLDELRKQLSKENEVTNNMLESLTSVYPFNEFEYVISHLLAEKIITLEKYKNIRNEYMDRNRYLYLFELAPRTFGQTWAENHIREVVPELETPSKEKDRNYDGEYDLWYDGIKIEVKASRCVDKDKNQLPPMEKALPCENDKRFDMNYQQLKTKCCDVFVWVGVWTNKIRYWVMNSEEVINSPYYSKGQHRGNVDEGQLWITEKNIKEFDCHLTNSRDILNKIVEKYNQNKKTN